MCESKYSISYNNRILKVSVIPNVRNKSSQQYVYEPLKSKALKSIEALNNC